MRRVLAWTLMMAMAAGPALAGKPAPAPGRHPDFSGFWSSASLTNLEREDDFKTLAVPEADAAAYEKKHRGKPPEVPPSEDAVDGANSEWWETDQGLARIRGQARSSWIVAPADGKRPFTAEAKAFNKARREKRKAGADNPEDRDSTERCLDYSGAGPPIENGGYNDNLQILQTGDVLVINAEWMHAVRVIRIGGGHPPDAVRLPGGDSTARWEGQELVIETTNFLPREVDAPDGSQTADMKVVERLSRISPTELAYSYRVTNPARFVQTWMAEMVLHPANGAIYEFACHEGNYGLRNMLSGARHAEAAQAQTGNGGK